MSRTKVWTALLGILVLAVAPYTAAAQGECTVNIAPEEGELAGAVTAKGENSFDLDVDGDGVADHTIQVNDDTEFEGFENNSFEDLAVGDLVFVKVEEQEDGSLLAEEVTLLFDEDDDNSVTGRIACVDPSSGDATAIHLVFGPAVIDHPFPALTLQVNLQSGTTYRVNKGNINTSGFAFNAANLSVGQRVTAVGMTFTGGAVVELDASRLILKLEAFDGTVVDGSVDTSTGTFQINITSASNVLLTEPLTVRTTSRTVFVGPLRRGRLTKLNTTDTYRVTGLLLRDPAGSDASDVIFLAKIVRRVRSGVAAPPVPVN